jgi:hypothetical protein
MKKSFRHIGLAACFALCGAVAGGAQAQVPDARMPSGPQAASPVLPNRFLQATAQLAEIEALAARIHAARTDVEKDRFAPAFEQQLAVYAKVNIRDFDDPIHWPPKKAVASVARPWLDELKAYEDHIANHEGRMKQLTTTLQSKPPRQISLWNLDEASGRTWVSRAAEDLVDSVVSTAEAAIALQVYNGCNTTPSNPQVCAQGVGSGVIQGNQAQQQYQSCWASHENKKPKWWRAALRSGCVAALVARLA